MDWMSFIDLVNPTRLEVLGIALALTCVLGILSAIKGKQFKWAQIASFLAPSLNFFWMILGYVVVAAIAALIDDSFKPGVIATYTIIVAAMVVKLKDQLSYLTGGAIPVLNWKLPLENKG